MPADRTLKCDRGWADPGGGLVSPEHVANAGAAAASPADHLRAETGGGID
ncbi:MAG: hypothetical protein ACKOES_06525 [Planctomycetaceae bacterium]